MSSEKKQQPNPTGPAYGASYLEDLQKLIDYISQNEISQPEPIELKPSPNPAKRQRVGSPSKPTTSLYQPFLQMYGPSKEEIASNSKQFRLKELTRKLILALAKEGIIVSSDDESDDIMGISDDEPENLDLTREVTDALMSRELCLEDLDSDDEDGEDGEDDKELNKLLLQVGLAGALVSQELRDREKGQPPEESINITKVLRNVSKKLNRCHIKAISGNKAKRSNSQTYDLVSVLREMLLVIEDPSQQSTSRHGQAQANERADKEREDKEREDKEREDKEREDKEKADKEKEDREIADREKVKLLNSLRKIKAKLEAYISKSNLI